MKNESKLIRSSFSGILTVNLISMVSGILCVMIDAVVTGQFLGADAMAASGLLQPVVMLCNVFGALFGPGVGVVCTRFLGMARRERVNQVFSVVVIALTASAAILSAALFAASPVIASVLGRNTGSAEIVSMITAYLRGFSLGLLPMCLNMPLNGLMMLDNDRKRSVIAMLVTLAADVVFDLANVRIFHGGMWGMAIATSLSQLAGLVIVLTHFLKKDRILNFTRHSLRLDDLKEVVLCGIPSAITLGSQALRGIVFNALVLGIAGAGTVAALSVCTSTFSVVSVIALGVFTTTSMLCSLLYGEEDREGLIQTLGLSLKTVTIIYLCIAAFLLLLPQFVAGLFLNAEAAAELSQAARFIRFMAVQYFLSAVCYSVSGAYQGTRQLKLNYLLDLLREGVFPVLCALALGKLWGLRGFELSFVVSGALVALCCVLLPWIVGKRFPRSARDLILLPEDFGPKPGELFTATLRTMDDVMAVSDRVKAFCEEKQTSKRVAIMTSLFVEEIAGNTVLHGFVPGRSCSVDLRLICGGGTQVIRLRDNGVPFDPLDWLKRNHPEDPVSGAGIRIIVGLASEVRCTPAMGLNNLMVII